MLKKLIGEELIGMFYETLSRDYEGRDFEIRFEHAKGVINRYTDEEILRVYNTMKKELGR